MQLYAMLYNVVCKSAVVIGEIKLLLLFLNYLEFDALRS